MLRTTTRFWLLIGSVLVLGFAPGLFGCGGSDDGGTAPGPGGGDEVGPAGGTVVFDGGAVTVIVPAGALDQATTLTAAAVASPPAGALAGTVYDLGPAGTTFDLPVTLVFAYDPATLPSGVWHADLNLNSYIASTWIPVTDSVVDSVAYTLTGATSHFSTFGVGADEGGEAETRTCYLKDNPAEGAQDEFDSLTDAMAWLSAQLGYEDLGILVWQTSTAQSVESLAFAYDLAIDVEGGHTATVAGPASGPLTIDAVGAIDLNAFTITAAGGLVLNANRNVALSGCTLPDVTTVNIGGVMNARFPAGEPGYTAKSASAQKRAKGGFISANRMTTLNVNFASSGTVEGEHTIEGNTLQRLNVGGPAILISDLIVRSPAPPAPLVPIPYPNIGMNMGGSSGFKMVRISGIQDLQVTANLTGDHQVDFEDLEGEVGNIRLEGGGSADIAITRGNMTQLAAHFAAAAMDVSIEDETAIRNLDLTLGGNTAIVSMSGGRFEEKLDIRAEQVEGQVSIESTDDVVEGDADITLPEGGNSTVTLTGTSVQGARLSIGPPGPKGASRSKAINGSVTLTDLIWSGSEASDHIDITGIDGPVTISGGTIANPSSAGVNLGLTEVGGTISVSGVAFTGGGIGLVDCTGAATIDGCNLNISAGYGVSMGTCAAVTVSGSQITCSGGSNAVQTYEMDGALSITGCTIDASSAATAFIFQGVNVAADNNSLIAGMVIISESSVHMSGNTFSGALVMDDLVNSPGLLNDPVQDNDGLLPGMVYTHMDWDGNGCCDYPPEWNETDANGACVICTAQGK